MRGTTILSTNRLIVFGLAVLLAATLLATGTFIRTAEGATQRYVDDTGGVDAGTCTPIGSACATIGYAISVSVAGDTINVAAGTYAESITIGLGKDNLTLSGIGTPLVDATGLTNGIVIKDGVDGVTVDGFEIVGDASTKAGIVVNPGSDNTTLTDNEIHGMHLPNLPSPASYGILVWGNDAGPPNLAAADWAGACAGQTPPSGTVINGNEIYDTSLLGISLGDCTTGTTINNNNIHDVDPVDIGVVVSIGIQGSTSDNVAISGNTLTNLIVGTNLGPFSSGSVSGGTFTNVGLKLAHLVGASVTVTNHEPYAKTDFINIAVNTTGYFSNIQDAIDAAPDGGTVDVSDGTYTEQLSISGKGLTVQGESEAGVIVQAAASQTGAANVFTIDAAGFDVTIQQMTIRNGDYGIRSSAGNVNVLNATLYNNGWDGVGYAGIPTQASAAADWAAHATDGGAIRIENSASSEIAFNTVYDNDRGIRFQDSDNGNIHDNVSHNNIQAGIYLAASTYTGATGSTNTVVRDNESYANGNNGILSIGGKNNNIQDNNVHDNWNSGVMLWSPAEQIVQGNTIDNNNLYPFNGQGVPGDAFGGGIAVDASSAATPSSFAVRILNNTISNNQAGRAAQAEGVRLDTPLPSDGIEITGNFFTNHAIGVHVRSQAATTTLNSNSFDGSGIGVQNDEAAITVDASGNWWGTNTAAGVAAEVSADVDYSPWLASGTDTDLGSAGFQGDFSVLHVDDDSPQSDATGHIQEGIDLVSGSTVNVEVGTYIEQVEIDKALTLTGAGEGSTFIQGFANMPLFFVTDGPKDNHPVVYVHDTTGVVIEDLTVDGDGKGNTNYRYAGIGVNNAGATIQDVTVIDVQDTPFSGAQHGVGIYAINNDATDRTVTVDNATVYDFQKTGIAINGDNAIGQVQYSTVTGIGPTAVIAQNGIQLGFGARGQILGNVVSAMEYTLDLWGATGILGAGSGAISIEWNNVTATQGGIRVDNYGGVTTGVTINDNTVDGNGFNTVWGADTVTIERNSFDDGSEGLWLIDASNVTGTDNSFNGNDYGLIIYGINGPVDGVAMSNSEFMNNSITGIDVTNGGADPINVSITTSKIAGNGAGLESFSGNEVLAERNWWGDATGADHATNPHGTGQGGDTASDNVDFTPWYATSTTTPSTENVTTTHNPVIALSDTIQGGIDAALDEDTVTVSAGTYSENVNVNKDVTLAGLNPPSGGNAAVVDGTVDLTADGATVESLRVVPGSVTGNERAIAVYAGNTTVSGNLIEGMIGDGENSIIGIGIHRGSKAALLNISVTDNVVRNLDNPPGAPYGGATGIQVQGVVDGVAITGNTIVDIHSAGWAYGIEITPTGSDPTNPPQSVQVLNNSVSLVNDGSLYDVWLVPLAAPLPGIGLIIDEASGTAADASQVTVTYNDFVALPMGAFNKDTAHILNAETNWWDACDGPSGIGPGSGVIVGDDIDFDPWEAGKCDKDNDLLTDDEEIFVYGTDPNNPDTDGDGCIDGREVLPKSLGTSGGGRDPLNPNDFYDVQGAGGGPKDGVIDLANDILGVILHYSPQGQPPYDVAFDRGPSAGPNVWNMTVPDGVIDLPNDILGVILQHNHRCV